MSLGFNTYADGRSFEKEGITGEVKRFSKEVMEYPNLILLSSEDKKIPLYKLKVLPNMFAAQSLVTDKAGSIAIYYSEGDKTIRLGKIFPRQVKAFLKLFEDNDVIGMLNSEKELIGDYMYILSD